MKDGWRWGNVPLPEAHLALIVVGLVMGALRPFGFGGNAIWAKAAGGVVVAVGATVVTWAIMSAGRVKLADPDRLVTTGPYSVSRHPMYVAWTLIYFGLMLIVDSGWLLVLTPVLAVWVHWESEREERRLAEMFGPRYEEFRSRVRRYL